MSPTALPNMPVILATAQEIASGMAFLHQHGIVHGDLTGGAVLSPLRAFAGYSRLPYGMFLLA